MNDVQEESSIDVRDVLAQIARGIPQIIGLALLGLFLAATGFYLTNEWTSRTTSTRVVFSFPGFERGEYPDHSKFQPDDLRAPAIVGEALRRQGISNSGEFQSQIRAALSIEGIIPPGIVKERDRIRASGTVPPAYIPDEYTVGLTLPRHFFLGQKQRENLLREIVVVYRNTFQRTYGRLPLAFGNAFSTLKNADFPEYEFILNRELGNITSYLSQLDGDQNKQNDDRVIQAGSFRSQNTNLSFKDLLEQAHLFSQIRLNETLGIIHENGLSRNRRTAMIKMDFYIRTLEDQERRAVEEESVVKNLLDRTQARAQNYVLGIKSQGVQPHPETPILDQGLIDSLLANDAYNFLVHRMLDAGLRTRRIQSDKAEMLAQRENIKSFITANTESKNEIMGQVQKSLEDLESAYKQLINNIRLTYDDFANQQFGNAIRLSDQVRIEGLLKPLLTAASIGAIIGCSLGVSLSLLRVYADLPKQYSKQKSQIIDN